MLLQFGCSRPGLAGAHLKKGIASGFVVLLISESLSSKVSIGRSVASGEASGGGGEDEGGYRSGSGGPGGVAC